MKQTCEKRRCLHPQLPVCAHCSICNLDGWFNTPKLQGKEAERPEEPPNLYECIVCLDIVHPRCIEKTVGLGQINHDLSNSWECAKCSKKVILSKDGKMVEAQLVHKPTQSNADSANNTGKRAILRVRPRRVRCKTCEACLGGDCKQCVYCKGKFIIFEVFT